MSSRNSISNRQSIATSRNASRSRNQAQHLIATSTQPAPHVLASTIYIESIPQPTIRCRAQADLVLAGLQIPAGMSYYLTASKTFSQRYYIVTGDGRCSARDEIVKARCIETVKQYRRELLKKQQAA